MTYNPNQPRDPAGSSTGGEWAGDGSIAEKAARKAAELPYKINSFREILDKSQNEQLYIRWSRGEKLDKQQQNSIDQVSHTAHDGLSAQEIHANDPELTARVLQEYSFLRMKDGKIKGWVYSGMRIGTDSDGAALLDSGSIVSHGFISEDLLEKLDAYTVAAHNYSQKYAYNAWKPEHYANNVLLEKQRKQTWEALMN